MKTFLFVLLTGFVNVAIALENAQGDSSVGEVKEMANKIRQEILKEEGNKIDKKLQDLVRSTPAKSDCLKSKADEANRNVKWALETYIDPLLSEIDRRKTTDLETTGKSGSRRGRQGDYYVKYIEERAQSAMTYAQAEADAATRWFASEALNC